MMFDILCIIGAVFVLSLPFMFIIKLVEYGFEKQWGDEVRWWTSR